jgi:hypothetical protein
VDWVGLVQCAGGWRAAVGSVVKLRVPWDAGRLSSDFTAGCLSSGA